MKGKKERIQKRNTGKERVKGGRKYRERKDWRERERKN